ncbi:MAG: alpha/beta hydrolase [Cyanobacteria bacterium J06598_3]
MKSLNVVGWLAIALSLPVLSSCNAASKNTSTQVIEDIEFATYALNDQPQSLRLDLHQPVKNDDKPWPVIVYIHGGGWEEKSRKDCPAAEISEYGYAVACVSYRYSSEATFPAQIHDVKAAVRWLRTHEAAYNLSADNIGVIGDSAGGHLSALLGTSAGVAELEGDLENPQASSAVQAVVDWFGPTDFAQIPGIKEGEVAPFLRDNRPTDGPPTAEASGASEPLPWAHLSRVTTQLLGGTVSEKPELVALANPITHITPDDPPFLIMHGEADTVVPIAQSELLVAALKAKGVPVTFQREPGRSHTETGIQGERIAPDILAATMAFFDAHLK